MDFNDLSAQERLETMGVPTDALGEFVASRIQAQPAMQRFADDIVSALGRNPAAREQYQTMAADDPAAAAAFAAGIVLGEQAAQGRRAAVRVSGDGLGHGRTSFIPLPSEPPAYATGPQAFAYTEPRAVGGELRAPEGEGAAAAALSEWQRTGSRDAARRYAHERLHSVISDEFLNE